jgi:nucleotide-binding universal stress UspA family protein
VNSSGTAAVGEAVSSRRVLFGSLAWALAVPAALTLAGWLAQYPYGMIVVAVIVALAVVAVAAVVAGSAWHRAGAATVTAVGGFALVLFAGPGLYQLYMETLGRPVPAVVAKVEDRHHRHGADMFCTVVETAGDHAVHEISEQENCQGQFKPLQHVTLHADPLGLLDPRLPSSPGETTLTTTLMISIGLFVLTGGAMGYAGLRRR